MSVPQSSCSGAIRSLTYVRPAEAFGWLLLLAFCVQAGLRVL